jgi:carboxylesterase
MPQPDHLDPSAYSSDGELDESQSLETFRSSAVGILLIHGFTGSVAETRPMGEYLAARGLAVRCPLLPGHGTSPEDLTRIRGQAWTDSVEAALCDLQGRCDRTFVGGLSLGALLTLWLGAQHPEVAGLIVMAPAVRVKNRLMPLALGLRYLLRYNPLGPVGDEDLGDPQAIDRIWCYDKLPLWGAGEVYRLQVRVRRSLSHIHQPVLIYQGCRDAQVPREAAEMVYQGVSSADKTLVWLQDSGHNLLADGERESVWAQSYDWIQARCS